jgi:glycosyltransferase involved in cell wall biosynthesis
MRGGIPIVSPEQMDSPAISDIICAIMKIVLTVPFTPWPVTRGTDRLMVNLIEGLSKRHEVTLVTQSLSSEGLERLKDLEKPGVRVRGILAPHRRPPAGKLLRKIRNVFIDRTGGVPEEISYAAPPEFLREIAAAAEDVDADLVIATYWHMYDLPRYVKGRRLVLATMDVDHVVSREKLKFSTGGPDRVRAEKMARRLAEYELEAYERYDTILTVTDADADMIRGGSSPGGKIILPMPMAMDLSLFHPEAFEREKNRIVFLGSFDSDFNRDALRFFACDVFPLIRAEVPEAVAEIVGQGVDTDIIEKAGPAIAFTGRVDDIRPYLGGCSVMVLPLRFAAGIRLRMMEAAAMGTPVVSTPEGVGGMGLEPGREYIEGIDASSLAAGVISLLRDPGEAARIGSSARSWAERDLSMETYPDRLDRMLEKVAG